MITALSHIAILVLFRLIVQLSYRLTLKTRISCRNFGGEVFWLRPPRALNNTLTADLVKMLQYVESVITSIINLQIISQPKRISDKMQHDHSLYFFFVIQGDRAVRGGEGWPAERNRDPAEGKGQVGIHVGGPQPRVQTDPWWTPSNLALPAVCAPSSDHALQPGSPGTDAYP